MKNTSFSSRKKGYSLLEMSIVITIIGLMLSGALSLYNKKLNADRLHVTTNNMLLIQKALSNYVLAKQALPCPALTNAVLDTDIQFGQPSGLSTITSGNCVTDDPLSSVNVGMVPIRVLNLPDNVAYDGYGNRFSYRIGQGLADATTFQNNLLYPGDIRIIDYNGYDKTDFSRPSPNNHGAAYVLLSHGPNSYGAYSVNGIKIAVPIAYQGSDEAINADDISNVFVQSEARADFDDITLFQTKDELLPPRTLISSLMVPEKTCANAETIVNAGDPTSVTNDLATWGQNTNQAQNAHGIYMAAKAMIALCQNQPSALPTPCTQFPLLPTGITLWLDAADPLNNQTQPGSGILSQWYDKSQGSTANNPVHGEATYTLNALFGNPVASFTGNATQSYPLPSLNITGNYSIFVAFRINNSNAGGMIDLGSGNNINITQGYIVANGNGNGYRLSQPISSNKAYVLSLRYNTSSASSFQGWVNAVSSGIVTSFIPTVASSPTVGQTGNTSFFDGDIAEVIIYNQALSDSDRSLIEGYLRQKWLFNGSCG